MYNLPQKLVAEFVGTFTLIFIGAGSICADQYLHAAGQNGVGHTRHRRSARACHRHYGHRPGPYFRRPFQSSCHDRILGHQTFGHS